MNTWTAATYPKFMSFYGLLAPRFLFVKGVYSWQTIVVNHLGVVVGISEVLYALLVGYTKVCY